MADAAWKKLNEKIKAKRTKTTKKDPAKNHRQGDQLTVQRLSAEVAGKAQKYTRVFKVRIFRLAVLGHHRPITLLYLSSSSKKGGKCQTLLSLL